MSDELLAWMPLLSTGLSSGRHSVGLHLHSSPLNFPVLQLRGSFPSLLLLPVYQQTTMSATHTFYPSMFTFCLPLCAQWGKQSPTPSHLASFVQDDMHSMSWGDINELSLEASACPQSHKSPVEVGEFWGTTWSKAQKLNRTKRLPSNGELGFWINPFVPQSCLAPLQGPGRDNFNPALCLYCVLVPDPSLLTPGATVEWIVSIRLIIGYFLSQLSDWSS